MYIFENNFASVNGGDDDAQKRATVSAELHIAIFAFL
jgi:hypothetical protein